jgi:S1-C subfamily serine protease
MEYAKPNGRWLVLCLLVFVSCKSAEDRLAPPKSTSEYRLSDIEKNIDGDPAKALYQAGLYRILYEKDADYEASRERLAELEERAVEKLKKDQAAAIGEKRWEDAASMARSLAALGIAVESTGEEPDIILAGAKDALAEGNNLKAFIAAVRAHRMENIPYGDVLPFLERAVEQKQRRTAAFFLEAADSAPRAAGAAPIPAETRAFAEGSDPVSDMVKGVATVIVDRGYKTEKGRAYPDRVLGSAFFVDSSGLLITNYHVIVSEVDPAYEGYSRMYVRMGDSASSRTPAKVIGWDKAMDLALIKADITPEYVFSVVDRIIPKTGDTVYAIGSPGGLEKTVTQGIVSALGRRFLQIGDVIQIDAAVNHGNSGGPVVDRDGRLVGIVFAGVEQYENLNFAVPAERLAAALPAMINGGKAERPWLGLTIAETSKQKAEVIYSAPFTPAWEEKIKEGSLIESLNGQKITAPQGALIPALQDVLFPIKTGELVSLETSDESGEIKKFLLLTAARPEIPLADAAEKDSKERMAAPLFGLVIAPAGYSGFSAAYVVKKVVRGSTADEAGLSEKDPVVIHNFRVEKEMGIAFMDISVKKKNMGYMESSMRLPALLDSPDTL